MVVNGLFFRELKWDDYGKHTRALLEGPASKIDYFIRFSNKCAALRRGKKWEVEQV